jgi:glutathione S-transferase
VRLQADHIGRTLVPAFYRYLQGQDPEKQIVEEKEFHTAIDGLVALFERAEREILAGGGEAGAGERVALKKGLGLWIESEGGQDLGWADVMVAPCKFSIIFNNSLEN